MARCNSDKVKCHFGGDIELKQRYCLHPEVIRKLGLKEPTDIATTVDLGFCGQCILFRLEDHNGNN
jgi:hypothetical protein